MKINELKQELNEKLERLNKLVSTEERSLTSEQETEFDNLSKEVDGIKKNVERLEKLEVENKSKVVLRAESEPVANKDFNVVRFLNNVMRNEPLTGAELEAHNRCKANIERSGQILEGYGIPLNALSRVVNATVTSSNETNLLKVNQVNDISIVKTPSMQLISDLGLNLWTSLTNGKIDIPYTAQLTAVEVGIGASNSGASFAPGKETLSPRRFQISLPFSKEYLAQTSPEIQAKIQVDMYDAILRAGVKDFYTQLLANTSVNSGTTGYTWNSVTNVKANIESPALTGIKFSGTLADMATLENTMVVGSTFPQFLLNNGKVAGVPFYGSSLATANKLIYGDFSYGVIGVWGIDVLYDPYTSASKGEVVFHVTGLLDTGIINPYAFAVITK
jgi:HK97 family phage major capsid protein